MSNGKTQKAIRTSRVVSLTEWKRQPLQSKDFLSILDLTPEELERLLGLAAAMKRDRAAGRTGALPLAGKHLAMLFQKPSLRTRTTFVIAVRELGGDVIESPADVVFSGRESVDDVARSLDRWVAGAIVRTFAQEQLARVAAAAPNLHVVNALTDEEHPCQALADLMTLKERLGSLVGRTLVYVGDGNNVAASLAHAGAMLGLNVRVASPKGFELPAAVALAARRVARHGATVTVTHDPRKAVAGADAVYTDVWTSMGQEDEGAIRRKAFEGYQVDDALMAAAGPEAWFLHCLPAHRGEEVAASVIDGPRSAVWHQAENRMHAARAALAELVGALPGELER
jgi:ornithine carbamoyltransferase